MSTVSSPKNIAKVVTAAFVVAGAVAGVTTGLAEVAFRALRALVKRALAARAAAAEATKARAEAERQQREQAPTEYCVVPAIVIVQAGQQHSLSGPARAAARRRRHHHLASLVAAALAKRHDATLQHARAPEVKPHLHKAEATLKRLEVGPRPGKLLEKHQHRQQGRRDGVHKATTR